MFLYAETRGTRRSFFSVPLRLCVLLLILIISGLNLDCLVLQRLLDELGLVALAFVLPATYIEVVLVVALSLAFLGLVLLAEVTTAGLVTAQSVESNELTHREEVTEVDSLIELNIEALLRSRNEGRSERRARQGNSPA